MSAPSGSGPTYLPLEYEYYYLEFVNWQNNNQGGGVSYNRTKNIRENAFSTSKKFDSQKRAKKILVFYEKFLNEENK